MAVKFNADKAFDKFKEKGGTTKFPDSLKQVLSYIQKDDNFNDIREVAWLLGTAKVESDYSLQRWESDYLCGKWGIPYGDKPCSKALSYFKSTKGSKKNYYNLGTDKKGLPYFGRGLIQLTGKSNYQKYGDLIGVDLVNNADKAIDPKNSYKIASAYFNKNKGKYYGNRTINQMVMDGDFQKARKAVKGSTKTWDEVKEEYDRWMDVLKSTGTKTKGGKIFGGSKKTPKTEPEKKKTRNNIVIAGSVAVVIVATFILVSELGLIKKLRKK